MSQFPVFQSVAVQVVAALQPQLRLVEATKRSSAKTFGGITTMRTAAQPSHLRWNKRQRQPAQCDARPTRNRTVRPLAQTAGGFDSHAWSPAESQSDRPGALESQPCTPPTAQLVAKAREICCCPSPSASDPPPPPRKLPSIESRFWQPTPRTRPRPPRAALGTEEGAPPRSRPPPHSRHRRSRSLAREEASEPATVAPSPASRGAAAERRSAGEAGAGDRVARASGRLAAAAGRGARGRRGTAALPPRPSRSSRICARGAGLRTAAGQTWRCFRFTRAYSLQSGERKARRRRPAREHGGRPPRPTRQGRGHGSERRKAPRAALPPAVRRLYSRPPSLASCRDAVIGGLGDHPLKAYHRRIKIQDPLQLLVCAYVDII